MTDINVTVATGTPITAVVSDTELNVSTTTTEINANISSTAITSTLGETAINIEFTGAVSPWKWDSTNSRYFLSIGGVKVVEIDSNGNVMHKGRLLKFA